MNTHGDATVLAACLSKPGRIKLWHLFQVSALLGTWSIFEEVERSWKICFNVPLDRLQEKWNVGHFVNYSKLVLSWQTKSSLTAYIYAGKYSLFMCLWNIRDNHRLEKTCQEGHPHAGNTGHILHQLKVSRTFRAWRPQTEIVAWLWCTDVDKIVSTLLLKKENSQWSLKLLETDKSSNGQNFAGN